ncbi:hypothetical protein N9I00_00235 [bacterium]|nr:hypothetical protein [bacterium]
MIYTWQIFYNNIFLGYQYAMTEYSAREKAFMIGGSASKYTGASLDNIKAVRIN